MSALPGHPGVRAVNHVLRGTPAALERLRPHAGRTVVFRVALARMALTVQATGEVASAAADATPDLTVRISPFLLPRLAAGEDAAFREIETEGDAELAQEVSFLARNLAWDVEEDLAGVVGDIAAHRIVGAARATRDWARESGLRVAQGAAEYWTEESPVLASRVKVEDFVRGVAELRDAVERLEKRIARLA